MIRFPPKKILLPYDFTEHSDAAWRQARHWAERFGAVVEVAYAEDVVPSGVFIPTRPRLDASLKAQIVRHVHTRLGARPRVHVCEDDPVVAILRLARTLRPHLIVMGTAGKTGLNRVWMGSVTEAVVRQSPIPVLTVKAGSRPDSGPVLAPVNFTRHSEHGFAFAAGVAASLGQPLTAFHAIADPEACLTPHARLQALVQTLPERVRKACRPRIRGVYASPVAGILQEAVKHGLIVLVAHSKSLMEDVVLGTTVERVLRHCTVPVLAVPAPRASPVWRKWTAGRTRALVTP